MKILLQRVRRAEVSVGGEVIGCIERGAVLLVGFGRADDDPPLARAAAKVAGLRIFPAADGRLQHSLVEVGGAVLAVPQFTLYAATAKGRRPDFTAALAPPAAQAHFDGFCACLEETPVQKVARGRFAADMQVSLVNDGPFTLMLEW